MLPNIPCGHSAQSSQLLNLQAHNLHNFASSFQHFVFPLSLLENKAKQQDSTKIKNTSQEEGGWHDPVLFCCCRM